MLATHHSRKCHFIFALAVLVVSIRSVAANPRREDLQPVLDSAALRAAEELPHTMAVAKLVIRDSSLQPNKLADCLAEIDATEKDLTIRYRAVKDGKPATMDIARPDNLVLGVFFSKIADPAEAKLASMQFLLEMKLSSPRFLDFSRSPTAEMRQLVAIARPDDEPKKSIDASFAHFDEAAAPLLKILQAAKKSDGPDSEVQGAFAKYVLLSRKTWLDVRTMLTKDQRRAIVAGSGMK